MKLVSAQGVDHLQSLNRGYQKLIVVSGVHWRNVPRASALQADRRFLSVHRCSCTVSPKYTHSGDEQIEHKLYKRKP